MPTSHGVVQGYNAQALVDDAYQVIVAAEVFGDGQDAQHLTLVMERAKATMQAIGHGADYFAGATFLADSNYFSDDNLKTCDQEHLDAYIPDGNFRKRDPRFANQERYQPKKTKKKRRFGGEDFTYDEATQGYRCPNGTLLRLNARASRAASGVSALYCGRAGVSGVSAPGEVPVAEADKTQAPGDSGRRAGDETKEPLSADD